MNIYTSLFTAAALLSVAASSFCANPADMKTAEEFAASRFNSAGKASVAPYSFEYGGEKSTIIDSWNYSEKTEKMTNNRIKFTQTYTDPASGMEFRCVMVRYTDFPTVEWTVYAKNNGSVNSKNLKLFNSLDYIFKSDSFLLHHAVGSPCTPGDYGPLETTFTPGMKKTIGGLNGRSTNSDMSYFNLELAPDKGVIIAVGWPGQWTSDWACGNGNLKVTCRQEYLDTYLKPGEEVRSPLTVFQFWSGGDRIDSQNVWRRWMLAHNSSRAEGGEKLKPMLTASSSRQFMEMTGGTNKNQIEFIDKYEERGFHIDCWWMDAGWYSKDGNWANTGTWEVDEDRFPNGLREVTDYAKKKGLTNIIWFEPERIGNLDTWIPANHPDWVHMSLLTLDKEETYQWLVEHICNFIKEQGVGIYRQDFNIDPLASWLDRDEEGRAGMIEQKHCVNLLRYWDEIARRFPGIILDECASGGRRNDMECMRRAVPLWRTDCAYGCIGTQSQTYGIAFWIPYNGTGTICIQDAGYYGLEGDKGKPDAYALFSNGAPSCNLGNDIRVDDFDYDTMLKLLDVYQNHVTPAYLGDYYPMTGYSLDDNVWMAYQFDRPEVKKGVVLAFRRPNCAEKSLEISLRALKPNKTYTMTELITGKFFTLKGSELMTSFKVTLENAPDVAVYEYVEK